MALITVYNFYLNFLSAKSIFVLFKVKKSISKITFIPLLINKIVFFKNHILLLLLFSEKAIIIILWVFKIKLSIFQKLISILYITKSNFCIRIEFIILAILSKLFNI